MDKGQGGCPGHHHCRCPPPLVMFCPHCSRCPTHTHTFVCLSNPPTSTHVGGCVRVTAALLGAMPGRSTSVLSPCRLVRRLVSCDAAPRAPPTSSPLALAATLLPCTAAAHDVFRHVQGGVPGVGWMACEQQEAVRWVRLGRWWSCGQMTRFSIIGLACVTVSRARSLWCIRCGHARRPLNLAPCQAPVGPHIIIRGVVVTCVHACLLLCVCVCGGGVFACSFVCVRACLLFCVRSSRQGDHHCHLDGLVSAPAGVPGVPLPAAAANITVRVVGRGGGVMGHGTGAGMPLPLTLPLSKCPVGSAVLDPRRLDGPGRLLRRGPLCPGRHQFVSLTHSPVSLPVGRLAPHFSRNLHFGFPGAQGVPSYNRTLSESACHLTAVWMQVRRDHRGGGSRTAARGIVQWRQTQG